MGRRQVFIWVTGSVLLVAGLLAVLVVPALRPYQSYADWVEDSGLLPAMGKIFWLEDGRVLFRLLRLLDPLHPRAPGTQQRILAIWTPGRPAVADIHTEDIYGGLCYADGEIRYYSREFQERDYVAMVGPMGRERRVPHVELPPGSRFNRFSCRYETLPARWTDLPNVSNVWPLRPGHGWIATHLLSKQGASQVVLHPTADHPGIDLGLNLADIRSNCFRWIAWRGAYFTDTCGDRRFREPEMMSGVWLWPDGRVEVPELPLTEDPGLWPTPVGWLVRFQQLDEQRNLGNSGLYLWRDGEYRLLLPGLFSYLMMSDDGCRAVMDHAPAIGSQSLQLDAPPATVKIVDLCGYLDQILDEAPVVDPELLVD